jgi:hypothetical protein
VASHPIIKQKTKLGVWEVAGPPSKALASHPQIGRMGWSKPPPGPWGGGPATPKRQQKTKKKRFGFWGVARPCQGPEGGFNHPLQPIWKPDPMYTYINPSICEIAHERVMLHIIPLSSFCPPKIDMAFKITIVSKFNSDLS